MACSLSENFPDPCWQGMKLCQNRAVMLPLWNGMANAHALHLSEQLAWEEGDWTAGFVSRLAAGVNGV